MPEVVSEVESPVEPRSVVLAGLNNVLAPSGEEIAFLDSLI